VSVAGLILAAGESRRMGSPKPLLQYHGECFLDRLIGIFSPVCSPVIVVLGAAAEAVRAGSLRTGQAHFVLNPYYRTGQLGSLQCGLQAVPQGSDVLFTLVDHPRVRPETVRQLVAAPALLRIPRFEGRRGHPVFAASALVAEFLRLGPAETAREVIGQHTAEIEYLDVDDPGVVDDIDMPEDYQRLAAEDRS
jgi:molybdenum cofactor cytidylyltransferase